MLLLLIAKLNCFVFQGVQELLDWADNTLQPKIASQFKATFPNSISRTVSFVQERTYIITGDIPAMWFRDSYNQIEPYIDFVREYPQLRKVVYGLLKYQSELMMLDPYPNAYYNESRKQKPYRDASYRRTLNSRVRVNPDLVHERKFEVDSIAFFVKLLNQFYQRDRTVQILDSTMIRALKSIALLIQAQSIDKRLQAQNKTMHYTFSRQGFPNELINGTGPAGAVCGLVRSGFRPSDDPVGLPYNIAANALLSKQLQRLVYGIISDFKNKYPHFKKVLHVLQQSLTKAYKTIASSLKLHSTGQQDGVTIYAQETDCNGKFQFGDDPNLPSLMSLPLYGFTVTNDPIWINTKNHLYSKKNNFYFRSENGAIEGLGSTHTSYGFIWPLGIMTRALVSDSPDEIRHCLQMLQAQGELMHQSFSVQNPKLFTREWFAWANSMYATMVLRLSKSSFRQLIIKK